MISTIIVSVENKSGVLARITIGLTRKGYVLRNQKIITDESGNAYVVFRLETNNVKREILASQLEKVIRKIEPNSSIENIGDIEWDTATTTDARNDSVMYTSDEEVFHLMYKKFPKIGEIVREYSYTLNTETSSQTLYVLGKQIGTAIYNRDWALGSPMKMPAALKRMLAPALNKMTKIKYDNNSIIFVNNPFRSPNSTTNSGCQFACGFMQGFLDAGPYTKNITVRETACESKGALQCRFELF